MDKIEKLYKKSKNIKEFALGYFNRLNEIMMNIDLNSIEILENEFEKIRKNGNTIFVAGNGGSASTASCMVNDIGFDILKRTRIDEPFKILSINDNNPLITAISNDIGYSNLFTSQLELYYRKGDVLLLISASGNSKNLIDAANWAKKKGGKIIAFLGFDGGILNEISDIVVHINTEKGEFGPVEDLHLVINHILSHWLTEKHK